MAWRGIVGALFLVFTLGENAYAGALPNGEYAALNGFDCGDFVRRYSAEVAARNVYRGAAGNDLFVPDYVAAYHYVSGWLSAYNMVASETYNIIPNGLDGAMLWLNNYCNKNPLKNLDAGLRELVIEAYPSRQQKPPGQ